jgi:hypothetical protein
MYVRWASRNRDRKGGGVLIAHRAVIDRDGRQIINEAPGNTSWS